MESFRLYVAEEKPLLNDDSLAAKIAAPLFAEYPQQEQVWCLALNSRCQLIGAKMITLGLVDKSQIHPREIFRFAIEAHASRIILAHNHPSGDISPSKADQEVTDRIKKAGDIIDIELIDHIIIGAGHYSFRASGSW